MTTSNHSSSAAILREQDINVIDQTDMKKAVRATVLGNFMEWFDVGIYSYLSASLTAVFFPFGDPWAKLAFFGALFATFIVRPLGGFILGPLGDKIGRRKVLAFTIIMMALGTTLIGFIPSYQTWGMAAPIALIFLKFVQGFSTGGEYAGATTFVVEYAPDRRRGFWSSFLDMSSYIGFAVAATLATVVELILTPEQMLSYGWRICFWIALPLGIVGLVMRSRVKESETFETAKKLAAESEHQKRHSLGEICKKYWPQLLIGSALVMCAQVTGFIFATYMPTYLTENLGYDALHGNFLLVPLFLLVAICLPFFGLLSDKIGRKPLMVTGAILGIVCAIPAFWLLTRGHAGATLAGLFLMSVVLMCQISVQPAVLPSLFPTHSRYSAMALMFNLSATLLGATAGSVVTLLESWWHTNFAGAYYMMFACAVGLVGLFFLKESAGRNLWGSMPSVASKEEAVELVRTQHDNPRLDLSSLSTH